MNEEGRGHEEHSCKDTRVEGHALNGPITKLINPNDASKRQRQQGPKGERAKALKYSDTNTKELPADGGMGTETCYCNVKRKQSTLKTPGDAFLLIKFF